MTQGRLRLVVASLALVALWIAVYWWTPAPPEAGIRFEPPAPALASAAGPGPETAGTAGPDAGAVKAEPAPVERLTLPPSFYSYTVRAGDTAETIASRFYGSSAHWTSVMQANPKTDFQHLRAGMTIRVPVDPTNVQGKPGEGRAAAAAGDEATRGEEPQRAPAERPAGVEYVVERGDTLTGLAVRFYGRASAWTLIRDANLQKLGAEGKLLREGMKITIPPGRVGPG